MPFLLLFLLTLLTPAIAHADLIAPLVAACDDRAVGAACSDGTGRCALVPFCRWDTCSERKRCIQRPKGPDDPCEQNPMCRSHPDERAQIMCLGKATGTACTLDGKSGTCGPRTRCVLHKGFHPERDLDTIVYCQEHHACRTEGEPVPKLLPGVHKGIELTPETEPNTLLGAIGSLEDPEPCVFGGLALGAKKTKAQELECERLRRAWRARNPCRNQDPGTSCGPQGEVCLKGRRCPEGKDCRLEEVCVPTKDPTIEVFEEPRQRACIGKERGGTCEIDGVAGTCRRDRVYKSRVANAALALHVDDVIDVYGCYPPPDGGWWPKTIETNTSPKEAPASPAGWSWLWVVIGVMTLGWAAFGMRERT